MGQDILALAAAAMMVGVTHTLLGPDHYLPFVVLARSRGWSRPKTALITLFCGLGHVASSVVLGTVGLAAGIVLARLEHVESVRGDIAAWLLFVFGALYALWGLWRFFSPGRHTHLHIHGDGKVHEHVHEHPQPHPADRIEHNTLHSHELQKTAKSKTGSTPWVLFIIFVFGPCEPLIPLLMYPAAEKNMAGAVVVAVVFSLATVATMLAVVMALSAGAEKLKLGMLDRMSHVIAGLTIALCGAAILFLGL
ncbi:MAG: sulfite exporter TauE/SafE family protein [Gemmatimonadota bacterium]|nr:sulfite exporter TauE/SafE family protein [Gemmatimonadota bacterium]